MLLRFLFAGISILVLVQAQDQSGFISLDCGLPANTSYTEASTELFFISDANYTDSGESRIVADTFKEDYRQHNWYLRSFPQGLRNCYTIKVVKGTNYLIRTNFLYGNYDGLSKLPVFDLYFGVNLWETVKFSDVSSSYTYYEIVHVPVTNQIQICLVNTGFGTPFISAIELRPLPNDTYKTVSGSLSLYNRWDIGSVTNRSYRFNYDVHDRIWDSYTADDWTTMTTPLTIDADSNNGYQLPTGVTSSAATPKVATSSMNFSLTLNDPNSGLYVYMHFAELTKQPNQTRSFDVTLNDDIFFEQVVPRYLYADTVYSISPNFGKKFRFSLVQRLDSDLPPILNALEAFISVNYSNPETDKADVDAMMMIKSTYKVKKNWQGDPCAPTAYTWQGVKCSLTAPFRIINLSLSSSGLTGSIDSSFGNLEMLQTLDLSNNSLTQSIPIALSNLKFLTVLKLDKNNLTGSIPPELIKRAKDGSLSLNLTDNPNMDQCQITSCTPISKTSIVGPIVGAIFGVLGLAAIVCAVIFFLKKKSQKKTATEQKQSEKLVEVSYMSEFSNKSTPLNSAVEIRERQFSYSEVVDMTDNFKRTLGRGGFGTVYYGLAGAVPVAVKILSTASARGYQQFFAEVNLLMRVHHRNLTSLVGYMNEGTHVGLIYEFMANGDLAELLSESSTKILTWEDRLRIALDAAQGLEYLHDGCKPPIIHRDVKTTNILLNEKFEAKIADFGLSKDNPDDGRTHVATTVVAGTPGYLDPEYYLSNRLTEKSDIYSFGVVLLEIISCRAVISRTNEMVHINQWANSKFTQGDIRSIVDPRLEGNYDVNSVWKVVEVAMACVSVKPERRPTMNTVVNEIKGCLATELSRKKQGPHLASAHSFDMTSVSMTADATAAPMAR